MVKPLSTTNAPDKPVKRARVQEPPSKLKSVRIKGSPPPKKQIQENVQAEPTPSSKSKGKRKEEPSHGIDSVSLPPRKFKIVAGSYEKLLYGLEGSTSFSDSNELQFNLKPIFIFPAHVSCIKAVAASPNGGKWLATGSADEIIKVWDLRRKKEIGGLMHHEGSVTHLHFPSRSHLLSASEDGTLCLFHARDWTVLRTLKGHKGRVNCVAVHPSGKLALSVGKDRTLRMWDLMRGKGCASTKLGKEGEIVRWSMDGSRFIVLSGSTIDVYDTAMTLIHTTTHPSRLHDGKFSLRADGKSEVMLIGAEDKTVSIYDVPKDQEHPPKIIGRMVGHSNRIKAIETLTISLPQKDTTPKTTTIVTTVSSDGKIHVYNLAALGTEESKEIVEIQPATEYDTKGTRLTCVTLAESDEGGLTVSSVNGKRKRDTEEDEESHDEEGIEGGVEREEEVEMEEESE
ncbi:WD40 repeat-like protein [Marasmius fiardii PR-910]|nr:WD40 repeat-like protein [Marasmius fiardii PR-910]